MATSRSQRKKSPARQAPSTAGPAQADPPIVSLVNLGCAKNLVDSERILGGLAEAGFLIAQDPALSELCLVNSCGFIQAAREETAAVLRELNALKTGGQLRTVVALGCMVERAADASELGTFLTHADARLGFKDYSALPAICRELVAAGRRQDSTSATTPRTLPAAYTRGPGASAAKKKVPRSYNDFLVAPRLRIGPPHTAYLKISEGCNNPCRFCAIPRMRGLQVSRPIEDLVAEAKSLVAGGCKELNLIAQDTTSYGQDLYGRQRLADLLRALRDQLGHDLWIRLLYAYPKHLTAEMLEVLASDERFCPYIDIPLQHIADPILASMQRGVTKEQTLRLLDLMERILPGGAFRTTFIVGYPGETEDHFRELLEFVEEGRFSHAGVFLYSTEPLTPSSRDAETVPLAQKQARRELLMAAQQKVSRKRLGEKVGMEMEVMVEGPPPQGAEIPKGIRLLGRSQREAPEVDGLVLLRGGKGRCLDPGTRIPVRVVGSLDYDLIAELPPK